MGSPFTSIARAAIPSLAPLFDMAEGFFPQDTPFPMQESGAQGPGAMAQGAIPSGGVPGVIYNVFSTAGFTPNAIYGVLGNAQQESGFNPYAFNAKEGAGGIFQWRFDRLTNGQAHAAQLGLPWADPRAQALWAVEEINRNPSLKARLNAARTPEEAATIFDREFEKSAGLHTSTRQKFARQWAGGTPVPYGIPQEMADNPSGLMPSQLPNAGIDSTVMGQLQATIDRIQGKEPQQESQKPQRRKFGTGIGMSEAQGEVMTAQGDAPGDTFDAALGQSLVDRARTRSRQRRMGERSLPRIQIPGKS